MALRIGICALLIVNICAFGAMGIDKRRAIKGKWRIPERTLFLWAALGGAWGSLIGMRAFRHKTKKTAFRIGIPLLCAAETILIGWIIWKIRIG